MSDLKRYSVNGECLVWMSENENGSYCEYKDVKKLQKKIEQLQSELTELKDANRLNDEELSISRDTINLIDDYFEYANESKKDRQKVHDILAVHMQLLMDMK